MNHQRQRSHVRPSDIRASSDHGVLGSMMIARFVIIGSVVARCRRFLQRAQRLTGDEFISHLRFERDAITTMPGHGLYSPEARHWGANLDSKGPPAGAHSRVLANFWTAFNLWLPRFLDRGLWWTGTQRWSVGSLVSARSWVVAAKSVFIGELFAARRRTAAPLPWMEPSQSA
jgi:hypothetical protein